MILVSGAFEKMWRAGESIAPEKWTGPSPKLGRMDRLCGLAMVAASSVLADAGLSSVTPEWNGERTAIVFGTAYGCHATNEDYYRQLSREGASPRLFAYTLPSSPVGEISILYRITGPASTLASGRTAGLDALGEAHSLIETGRADRVLVIAAEVSTPLLGELLGDELLAGEPTKTNNDRFDSAAALLLERADSVSARGGRARGLMIAYSKRFNGAAPQVAADEASTEVDRHAGNADCPPLALFRAALGAAPLLAAARFFLAPKTPFAKVIASDPDGAGAAAILGVQS